MNCSACVLSHTLGTVLLPPSLRGWEEDESKRTLDFLTDTKVLHEVTSLTWEERVTGPMGFVRGPELSPPLAELQTGT